MLFIWSQQFGLPAIYSLFTSDDLNQRFDWGLMFLFFWLLGKYANELLSLLLGKQ